MLSQKIAKNHSKIGMFLHFQALKKYMQNKKQSKQVCACLLCI